MFRSIIWLLHVAIYVGAIATVVACTVGGPEISETIGFTNTGSAVSYGIGAATGLFAASIVFGIPVILLSINSNLAQAVELLKTMQPGQEPSLVHAVVPTLVDHALDTWQSA